MIKFLNKDKAKKGGISILGILLFGFLLILVLSYFHISIKAVVESPTGQENINYVGGGTQSLWVTYLEKPAAYLWNDIWVDLFWKPFVSNMQKIRDNKPTDFQNNAPDVNFNRTQ